VKLTLPTPASWTRARNGADRRRDPRPPRRLPCRSPGATASTLLALSACLLAGCHRHESPDVVDARPSASAPRELRRGNGPEPDSLDPQKAITQEGQTILRDLFECLTTLDHEGRPAPGAAESWVVSPDGMTYTFTLRPTARWSTGDRVTGADFVAGLRRLVDPSIASQNGALIDVVRHARDILGGRLPPDRLGVDAPDDSTVVVRLEHPAPYLPSLLSHPSTCPVHRATLPQKGTDLGRPRALVSNGAFVLSDWIPGQYIVARRNRFYWNNQKTYWDRVMYLHIEDANAEFLRYRTGELPITASIPRRQFAYIQENLGRELHVTPALSIYYYGFNLDRPPFRDNLKLRQAMNLVIDREQLAQKVLRAGERPAYTWVPGGIDHYTPQSPSYASLPTERRLQMARQLLKEAGYSATHPLRFELRYNAGEIHSTIAIAIAQVWKETLGADVQLTAEDFRTLLSDVGTGQVQLFRSTWAADYNDALSFLQVLRSDSGINQMHYRSPAFDALLDQAAGESDPAERAATLQRAESLALRDAPVIPLFYGVARHLVKPTIAGWYDNVMNVTYSKDLSPSVEQE
jgi:oligopeptide transport system substrate-binding protein